MTPSPEPERTTPSRTRDKALDSYGPIQFGTRADLSQWQFDRAQRLGLIPAADRTCRWPASVFDDVMANLDTIRKQIGTLPDVGADRADRHLAERFPTVTVHPGTAAELARRGHLPLRGSYMGHDLYCGLTLEGFASRDRPKIDRASRAGQLHMRDAAAAALGIRESDLHHLVRAGLLAHAAVAEGWYKSRVLLYRQGDLDRLLRSSRIDWTAVRTVRKGQRSPLAALPCRKEA